MKFFLASLLSALIVGTALGQGGNAASANDLRQLQKFEKAYQSAKARFKKNPKNGQARQAFVIATDRYATATMTSLALGPRVKYPKALRLYREALTADPTNREAKNNSQMIEAIYRQMGRPIPK